jgi:UDP-2-acetamido-2,6-beta-L-arabino-hexul-4-ose reductase
MIRIAVTGSEGFLGWHVRAYFHPLKEFEVVSVDRKSFNDRVRLLELINGSDVIVHLAGMNRGVEQEIYDMNIRLTNELISVCEELKVKPHILFSSSSHVSRDTAYGRSKKESGRILMEWANKNSATASNLILPNIFGEFGRPFYNSAVATFCYQLSRGESSEINKGAQVSLVYAQDVVRYIHELILSPAKGNIEIVGKEMEIGTLYELLQSFKQYYFDNVIPPLKDNFEKNLFNTFRSYLIHTNFFPRPLDLKTDNRGALSEVVKNKTEGQVFYSTTNPGFVRGNHYHKRKIERFCVISGEAEIKLRKLFSDEIISYKVVGTAPSYIDMPSFYVHNITNIGESDLVTIFWVNEIFNPKDPDTYPEQV